METPRSARLRQSVSRKSYIESPVDSPGVRKSLRKSIKEKSDSPDENKTMNTPKSVKTPSSRLRKSVVDLTTPDDKEMNVKATATTPRGRRKSTRDISQPENFSPKKLRTARTPSTRGLESIVLENSPSLEKLESPSRPQNERNTTARYSDINLKINIKDQTVKRVKDAKAEKAAKDNNESSSEEEFVDAFKPTTLFDDEEDVEGQKLYSFKTPKKRDSMAQLVHNTPKTPHRGTPKTPKNDRLSQIQNTPTSRPLAAELAKTPRHVRAAIKKSKFKVLYQLVNI